MGIVRAQYSKCHPRHFFISRRSLARLTEIGRCFVARYKRGKRSGNLKKSTFFVNIPNFIHLCGRAYPVRHYPVAIRLRTRKGCAILCIAPSPQSGDSSGAILGVRSVALLHLTKVLFWWLGVLRFILGSSLVHLWSLARD